MRNTTQAIRDTWAALVTSRRSAAGLSKVELARRLEVDRATISRWEQGSARPERADVVQRFAELFAVDLEEALAAAGLRPPELAQPKEPQHPALAALERKLRDPRTNEATRQFIIRSLQLLAEAHAEDAPAPSQPPRRRQ